MKLKQSMKVANAVLAVVEAMLPNDDEEIYLEPYKNGRENGWALHSNSSSSTALDRKVVFSEYRNSDQIVIYQGRMQDFDVSGNVPDEACYQTKVFFDAGQIEKAARHILDYLLD